MERINTQYLEEIRCKIVPKPERNTKTIIGGGENYGKRPLFVEHGTGLRRYSCGNCNLVLIDNVGENIWLVNIVLKCPCDCHKLFAYIQHTTKTLMSDKKFVLELS